MELFTVLDQIVTPGEPRGGDVVAEATKRRWIMPFATGQYVYGPEWTALTRHLQQELLTRAARIGFQEWLFPRMIPAEAVRSFQLTQFAPHLLLTLDGGKQVLDPVQCLPMYHLFANAEIDSRRLPLRIVETMGGWTWRDEAVDELDGPIRAREFLRVEHVWLAPHDEGVTIRAQVRDSVVTFLRELGLSVQVVVGEGCMDIPSIQKSLSAAQAIDEVPVLDLEIPLRDPLHADGSLRPNAKEDFEEICGCTVEGDHQVDNFGIHSDAPGLASGCCGVGLNRLAVGFLYQHGFDPTQWPIDVPAARSASSGA